MCIISAHAQSYVYYFKEEGMSDNNWKRAIDHEFDALVKNKT
jgi:hypothetical protein